MNPIPLYYEKSGSGRPLLLLHGNGEDHHIFDALVAKLKNHYTIYAIDSRNHGQSTKTDNYSYRAMATDMFALLNTIGEKKVSLLGFSDGAIIGLMMAMEKPSVFDKLVLLGVNLKPSDFKENVLRSIVRKYEETGDPLLKLMLEEPDIKLEDVREVCVETLIVAAEKDVFKQETFTDLAIAMPNARLKIMRGHKHETYIENSDLLYPDLVEFLR